MSFTDQSNTFGRADLVTVEFYIYLDKRTKKRPSKNDFLRILTLGDLTRSGIGAGENVRLVLAVSFEVGLSEGLLHFCALEILVSLTPSITS